VLTTVLLLFADLLVCGIVMFQNPSTYDPDAQEIMAHLSVENGTYRLDKEESENLVKHRQFAMLLNHDGTILWSESLPDELRKTYTLQDVAKFTRYYFEDYPVRTYVVGQGLLIIGEKTDQVWKYTFEYGVDQLQTLAEIIPLLILANIVVLVSVPSRIQKRHAKQKEEERTEWIAGVSHDIRTPLAIVLGNAEIIAGSTEEAELKQRTEAIKKQGMRLRRLVDNLNLLLTVK
jgi:signal transduction histidine kinase